MTLPNGRASLGTYILVGACGAVFFAIFALMRPDIATLGLWIFPLAAGSGAIVGAVLHATRAWKSHGPVGELLRWILGLTVVGLVAGLLAISVGAIDIKALPVAVALGILSGCGFGLKDQQRTVFGGHRKRTRREIVMLWLVILGSIGAAGILFSIGGRQSA
jgi:hypothetical protein